MKTDEMNASANQHEELMRVWNGNFLFVALLAFLVLFINLHVGDLSGYDDAFHAEQAKAILKSGDWFTIRHNGNLNSEFPPLFYWLEAVSMKMLGVNDFAAKFPSALLGFAAIIAIYFTAFQLTGQVWVALGSMIILATTQYFLKYATHAMTDVPFAFFVTVAVLFYLKGFRHPSFFLLSGFCVALGLLTRPFVGILPLAFFATHLLWIRRRDLFSSRFIWGGVALSFLFPALWYCLQYHLHGAESVMRPAILLWNQLTSGKAPDLLQTVKGLFKYPWLLIKMYWPWLPFMLVGMAEQGRRAFRERDSSAALLLSWIFWIVLPFSLGSAKQLRYIMPVFPAFAVLAAIPICRWVPSRHRKASLRGVFVLGCVALLIMFFFPGNLMRATEMRTIAPIAESNSLPDQRVIFYTEGTYLWNYQNQFLWYADRYTDYVTTLEAVRDRITAQPGVPVVMDRASFPGFESLISSAFKVVVLGESERFYCFQAKESTNPSMTRSQ